MKGLSWVALLLITTSCQKNKNTVDTTGSFEKDSVVLVQMINEREKAMIKKNIREAISQFSDDATWVNSQGYFFKGKEDVKKFHLMLAENDSKDYYYEAGKPLVRVLDSTHALAYYSWKMFWYKKENPTDTIFKEVGLMTLNAQKQNGEWKWTAITNQHTPWFYPEIAPITAEEE